MPGVGAEGAAPTGRCTVCQFPFRHLKIGTPAGHVAKCKRQKAFRKKECPDGVGCRSSMESHFKIYSHDQSFQIFPRRNLSLPLNVNHTSKHLVKEEYNATLPGPFIDLTDSQTSSEEFSTQSSGKSQRSPVKVVSSFDSTSRPFSFSTKHKLQSQNTSFPNQSRISSNQKTSSKSKTVKKFPAKKFSVKKEKPVSENPWSITASQVAKMRSPLKKIQNQVVSDFIDLTLEDEEEKQPSPNISIVFKPRRNPRKRQQAEMNSVETEVGKKSARRSLVTPSVEKRNDQGTVDTKKKKFPVLKIEKEDELIVNLSKNGGFLNVSSVLDDEGHSFKNEGHNAGGNNSQPMQSTQLPKSKKTGNITSATADPRDSEEWSISTSRGPGFAPVSPICIEKNSALSCSVAQSSDSEDFSTILSDADNTKENSVAPNLTVDKNDNVVRINGNKSKKLDRSGEEPPARPNSLRKDAEVKDKKIIAGNSSTDTQDTPACSASKNDDNSESDSLDCSLLLGLSQEQTLPISEATPPQPEPRKKNLSGIVQNDVTESAPVQSGSVSPLFNAWLSSTKVKKQGDVGSMLFGLKPKVNVGKRSEVEVSGNGWKKTEKGRRGGYFRVGDPNRKCPFYKKVAGSDIAVDAFSYGAIEGIRFYFLSHFHSDHYMGLNKKTWKQKVYCGTVTANLVHLKIGLHEDLIVRLPLWKEVHVGDSKVTLLEANHCPGAVLFLFKLRNNRVVLHTGDFRARAEMEDYSALQGVKVETLHLDTTYLNPNYCFPLQSDVIKTAVSIATNAVKDCPKTLFVVGTYLIGKERIFAAIAKSIGSSVFVTADKFRTIHCLEDEELSSLVTKSADGARVHVASMSALNVKDLRSRLQKYPEFKQIIAIKPTGWTHDNHQTDLSRITPTVSGPVKIYGLPYSEHSSFEDLRRFVKFLKPSKVIPTVNVGRKESRDMMQKYLDRWKVGLDPR